MTVLLSFEGKIDDARACAYSGHCPFNFRVQILSRVDQIILKKRLSIQSLSMW